MLQCWMVIFDSLTVKCSMHLCKSLSLDWHVKETFASFFLLLVVYNCFNQASDLNHILLKEYILVFPLMAFSCNAWTLAVLQSVRWPDGFACWTPCQRPLHVICQRLLARRLTQKCSWCKEYQMYLVGLGAQSNEEILVCTPQVLKLRITGRVLAQSTIERTLSQPCN